MTKHFKEKEKIGYCGDGICNQNENCWVCPIDCKCKENEYCDEKEKKCVKTTCGNLKCELGEHEFNCCIDCPCKDPNFYCNPETKKCELRKFEVEFNESIAIESLKKYLEEKNISYSHIEIIRKYYNPNLGYGALIRVDGIEGIFWFFVSSNYTVYRLDII